MSFFFIKFQGGAVAAVQHPTRRPCYLVILSLDELPNMSNPLLTTTHSKLDTRVKEPSGVGLGSTLDCFKIFFPITRYFFKRRA